MTSHVIGHGITLDVRRAHPSDAALVALAELAEEELQAGNGGDEPRRGLVAYRWLVSLATRSETAVISGIVAQLNGGTVGMGTVVVDGDSALLYGVFVAPSFRGIGVGRSIVQEARAVADGLALHTLALPGDRRTKNLFEQAGMPAQLIVAG